MKKELMGTSNLTKPENAETGRTMVEMLGTLAIIGILSIGGVTGYGRAIKTYRTNSAVETAQRQAAIVAGEVGLGQAVSPGSATVLKAPAGYEVAVKNVKGTDTDITSTSPYFGVEIGGNSSGSRSTPLQSEVAKEMLERAIGEWKNVHAFGVKSSDGSSITWLNSTGSGDHGFEGVVDDAKTVVIIVVYASDLSLRPETGLNVKGLPVNGDGQDAGTCTEECNPCQKCEDGSCAADASKDNTECVAYGITGTCNEGVCEIECPLGSSPAAAAHSSTYRADGELMNGRCCLDGYAWDGTSTQTIYLGPQETLTVAYYNVVDIDSCACPTGAAHGSYVTGSIENGECCWHGYGWNDRDKGYMRVDVDVCGCPEDQHRPGQYGTVKDGICCSSKGFAWTNVGSTYEDINIEACGCPTTGNGSGQTVTGVLTQGVCCAGTLALGSSHYDTVNPVCGCPTAPGQWSSSVTGIAGNNNKCCADGYAYNNGYYMTVDIESCGCPKAYNSTMTGYTTGTVINGVCCADGKAYGQDRYNQTNSACE